MKTKDLKRCANCRYFDADIEDTDCLFDPTHRVHTNPSEFCRFVKSQWEWDGIEATA